MKCLVTGANGFLGGHLCKKLEQLGHSVYKLPHQDLPTITTTYLQERFNIEWTDEKHGYTGFNYIFNLAAYGNHSSQWEKHKIIEANFTNLDRLLEVTAIHNYEAFINVGSSSEYGRKGSCMREDMVLNPDSFYAATKAAGTHLARAHAKTGRPIITVRPFSVYGQGEGEHRFIPTVIRKIRNTEEIELVEGEHDWIHVDDVVDGMIKLLPHAEAYKGEVFNIGTGEAYTNEFVVNCIEKILGKKATIKRTDKQNCSVPLFRPFDSGVWCADISKLRSVIGFDYKPRHIITGLKELVNEM